MARLRKGVGVALIVAMATLAYVVGVLRPVDDGLAQLRYGLLQRPASHTLTVVEIDVASLRAAGTWPWNRDRFAQVIENLTDAGAELVALDVDFSARSSDVADAALEGAIRRSPGKVVLPTFVQSVGRGADEGVANTRPLGRFLDQAVLASVNVPVDSDGRVRHYRYGFEQDGTPRASMAATLAGAPPGRTGDFLIDYGIRHRDIDRLSFEAVRSGRFDPELVRGRKILIGATAVELGDEFATPRRGVLQGVYIHALAYESLHAGRALRELQLPILLLAIAAAAFTLRPRGGEHYAATLQRHALVASLTLGGPIILQAWLPVSVDASPILLAQGLCLLWVVRTELVRRAQAVVEAREAHLIQIADHMRESRDEIRLAHDELKVVNAALDKALQARTDFLAMTSHEIRTPLNGIMGMTQVILADRALSPELRSKVGLVHASGETMQALVDDILDVAKMEGGHLTISPAQMDLHRLLDETAQLWTHKAEAKGLTLRLDWGDTPALIREDCGRLRQILFNLTANAIKFTACGEVAVSAWVEPGETGETLAFDVTDSGIGIPSDKLEQIFEAFSQVDEGVTRQYGGTGLGLAISRRLARAMGGDLTVESVLGQGSCFKVRLPLSRAGHDARGPGAEPRGEQMSGLAAAAVLLVDANPLAQGVLRAALGGEVSSLEIVGSAEEAAAALAGRRFDLVLVDGKTLPPAEPQTRQALAGLAQAGAGARVAVLWAGDAERMPGLEQAGAALVIAKPIGTAELVERLRALCVSGAEADDAAESVLLSAVN